MCKNVKNDDFITKRREPQIQRLDFKYVSKHVSKYVSQYKIWLETKHKVALRAK